jgi:hypothetical protein
MVSGGRNEFLFLFLTVSSFQTPCCFPHDERAFCSSVPMTLLLQPQSLKKPQLLLGAAAVILTTQGAFRCHPLHEMDAELGLPCLWVPV